MKIGILTFHRAHNYGAVLQCYALQEYIKSQGHEVFVIDYYSKELLKYYKILDFNRIRSKNPMKLFYLLYREISLLHIRKKRAAKFDKFISSNFSLLQATENEIDTLHMIIIGSDQVWNTKLTSGFDKYYWGNFKRNRKTKLISYAASIGQLWDSSQNHLAATLLDKFDGISVRENLAATYLNQLIKKDIDVVVDPTLLLNTEMWNAIAVKPQIKDEYIFVYQVRVSKKCLYIANEISKKTGLKIVYLSAREDALNSKECAASSPEEFLGWLKYAKYVVCSSFHGTVFSCIYDKKFISVKLNDGKDDRVQNLLTTLGIQHRFVDDVSNMSFLEIQDYTSEKISEKTKHSIEYLNNYLK